MGQSEEMEKVCLSSFIKTELFLLKMNDLLQLLNVQISFQSCTALKLLKDSVCMMKYKLQKLIKFRNPGLLTLVSTVMLWQGTFSLINRVEREKKEEDTSSKQLPIHRRCDFVMNYGK